MTEQRYQNFKKIVDSVTSIFSEYYEDENVDTQIHIKPTDEIPGRDTVAFDIIIRVPKVKVTNEHNKSVIITEVYIKISFSFAGKLIGTFGIKRGEYTRSQIISDYCHSHICGIPKSSWGNPCLGNGPIRQTCITLSSEYNESILKLFCYELEGFLKTESLRGVPYRKLELISGSMSRCNKYNSFLYIPTITFCDNEIAHDFICKSDFIPYLVEHLPIKFCFQEGSYRLATEFSTTVLGISAVFIDWYNNHYLKTDLKHKVTYSQLVEWDILCSAMLKNGLICIPYASTRESRRQIEDFPICKFKGKTITIKVVDDIEFTDNTFNILSLGIIYNIVTVLTHFINLYYAGQCNRE